MEDEGGVRGETETVRELGPSEERGETPTRIRGGRLGFGGRAGPDRVYAAVESCRSSLVRRTGEPSRPGPDDVEEIRDRSGPSGGGVESLTLALQEKGAVEIDPILEERRAVGLDEEIDLGVIRRGR